MSIFNHFSNLTLSAGQETALKKLDAFLENDTPIFMLKGYAGSGKTTLLKGLVTYLSEQGKQHILMAPTGRAAKVLRDKTAKGVTIHKGIYNFQELVSVNKESKDDAEHSFHYYFPLNPSSQAGQIIIVDEASMVSSKESKHELFTFGTGYLLADLLTYASLTTTGTKIIFVGDPAQLPPVGDPESLALDINYFEDSLNLKVEEVELTDVMRQNDNLILANAVKIRNVLKEEKRAELAFEYDETTFIKADPLNFLNQYTEMFPTPELGNGVIISYSNTQCFHYNIGIREKIFPGAKSVIAGDLLLINNNNYHTYGVELFNGDIAKVVEVSEEVIHQSAPVFCDEGGVQKRRIINLSFRQVSIRVPNHPEDIKCYIIDSLLNSYKRDLSICEMKALYINFKMRFSDEQGKRKASGLPIFKVGSEEFRQALKADPYYNALRVKYGYAITCHKAQGGEWPTVFIDYVGRVSLKNDPLRWSYTATTRGVKKLFALNAPHFGKMDAFKIGKITQIGKTPVDAISYLNVTTSPFHTADSPLCKSLKYWEIKEKLENTKYNINNIVSTVGGYLEQYFVCNEEGKELRIQASHNGAGFFLDKFRIVGEIDESTKVELESIFNADCERNFSVAYNPVHKFLEELDSWMQQAANESNVQITNVTEGEYHINYFLKTDAVCAQIQFYYNNKEQLTTAMPKTFNCTQDSKLQSLIEKLSSYAV